jgi:hypothetical protein
MYFPDPLCKGIMSMRCSPHNHQLENLSEDWSLLHLYFMVSNYMFNVFYRRLLHWMREIYFGSRIWTLALDENSIPSIVGNNK